MTIEKLTDTERFYLARDERKALRIIDAQAAEIELLRAQNREHEQRWLRAERDGIAAEARCAELEAERGRWQSRLAPSAAEVRLAELEATCSQRAHDMARLRVEGKRIEAQCEVLESRLAETAHAGMLAYDRALTAEARCEELEAQLQDADTANLAALRAAEARCAELDEEADACERTPARKRELQALARLAEATALLERIIKYAREDEAVTPGFTRLERALGNAKLFLANQPAAPTVYHMVGCDARDGLACTHECATHRYGQPAAPAHPLDDKGMRPAEPPPEACVECALDVPLSKAHTLSIWAELQLRPDNPCNRTEAVSVKSLGRLPEEAPDMKKREAGCECHLEEGDSPCAVHGLYEAEAPARTVADPLFPPHDRADSNCGCRLCLAMEGQAARLGPYVRRTEAEQAVLDAMGEVPEETLRDRLGFKRLTLEDRAVYSAELARRELK